MFLPEKLKPGHPTEGSSVYERLDSIHEFERMPVPRERLEPARHFAAIFAGEHVAGTEFVIGVLFVSWGVGTRDLVLGLLIGNLLAVLAWTFVCAPIAVETRLTLYWYLRRIAGPVVTSIYNVVNAILFCGLAGAMITVSASAVRIPFGIPPQTLWYPTDLRFVLVVLGVGLVVVVIAILGFKRLAEFSTICVPWVFVMFFAGALAVLPQLIVSSQGTAEVHNFQDLWKLADQTIWIGREDSIFGLWHVAGFALLANLAFHIGLSDMALLRYAPNIKYGLLSACGMYMGHFLVWLAAGVMGAGAALLIDRSINTMDSGEVAYQALGLSGALCVIISGWATSNPTLYRAGLALQVVTPGWPRWLVTLLAGIATVGIACFPYIFQYLLEYAGTFAVLMTPIAAVVFVEHWIFPRIGLQRYWFERSKSAINRPALIAWITAVLTCFLLWKLGLVHVVFLALPGWLVASVTYTVLASLSGAINKSSEDLSVLPQLGREQLQVASGPASFQRPAKRRNFALQIALGVIALLSLMTCIALAVWVGLLGAEEYQQNLAIFKAFLAVTSLVHLTAAAAWVMSFERSGVRS